MDRTGTYGNPGGRDVEVATVRAIYDAFERRDVEAALAFIARDVSFYPRRTATMAGRTAPYEGHAGVREYFRDAERVWDDLTLRADDIRAAAGGVVVFGNVRGLIDGRPVERRVVWTWQVRGGRAVSMRVSDLGEA